MRDKLTENYWEHCVIEASQCTDEELCFVALGFDEQQRPIIKSGLYHMSDKPPGKVLGVIHPDGEDAAKLWVEQNVQRLTGLEDLDLDIPTVH